MSLPNYYEFLQISPKAEPETIQRVYRFLAMRLHPDNPETGDSEKFILLQQAYEMLSDPARRSEYDLACEQGTAPPDPLSHTVDFMDSLDGELNRRLAVLALLYMRRRTNPDWPAVGLHEIETRMGFPRDYLEFTLWYLQRKGYISRADNAEFVLLAEGVDFVEKERHNIPVLNKLLTRGSGEAVAEGRSGRKAASATKAAGATILPAQSGTSDSEAVANQVDKSPVATDERRTVRQDRRKADRRKE